MYVNGDARGLFGVSPTGDLTGEVTIYYAHGYAVAAETPDPATGEVGTIADHDTAPDGITFDAVEDEAIEIPPKGWVALWIKTAFPAEMESDPGRKQHLVLGKSTKIFIETFDELLQVGSGDPGYPADGKYVLLNDIDASATAGSRWATRCTRAT